MKKSLCATAAVLAILFAVPAFAAEPAPATPSVHADLSAVTGVPEPVFVHGRPDEFPSQGRACRIPPPFQPESCICPLIFDPVCGCNGVTYSNACFARCEVRFFTEGACGDGGEI